MYKSGEGIKLSINLSPLKKSIEKHIHNHLQGHLKHYIKSGIDHNDDDDDDDEDECYCDFKGFHVIDLHIRKLGLYKVISRCNTFSISNRKSRNNQ